jgi:CheY-like chemotaxis protein
MPPHVASTSVDAEPEHRAVHPHRRRSVLLVEDDPDAREMLAIVLAAAGCSVQTAIDGRSGLEIAATQHLDLVITDIAMPRMDGIQMVEQLRQTSTNRLVPVIALSGQAVADVPAKAHAAGCTEVLSKPCCPDYLLSVINQYIGTRATDRSVVQEPRQYSGKERRRQ